MKNFLQRIIKSNKIHAVIIALLFIIAINYYFNLETIVISFFNILIFYMTYLFCKQEIKCEKKEKRIAYAYGLITSGLLLIGKSVYNYHDLFYLVSNVYMAILTFASLIGFATVIGKAFLLFSVKIAQKQLENEEKQWKKLKEKKCIVFIFIIIIVSFLPAFYAYYPGIFSYDMQNQMNEIMNGITMFHPPIHTFIWLCCFKINGFLGLEAITIYAIIQMIFFAIVYTKFIKFLINRKVNNWMVLFALLFITVNPVISIFSIVATKDTYFAGFLLLTMISLAEYISYDGKISIIKKIELIIFIVLSCLFRNNAIYVFIICLIIFTIFGKNKKDNFITFLTPIIIFYIIIKVLYPFLGVEKGNIREMLSVPMQQIALVVSKHEDELDNETKEEIAKFLNYNLIKQDFNYRFADPIKEWFNTDFFKKNKGEFIKLWLKLLLKYPKDFINEFLDLNIPYWYIDAKVIDDYAHRGYIETGIFPSEYYKATRVNEDSALYKYYNKVANYELFDNIPIISRIFSLSFPSFVLTFALFISIFKKDKKMILFFIPLILLLATYILGPVSNFRYIFPIFIQYPLVFISIILNKKIFIE